MSLANIAAAATEQLAAKYARRLLAALLMALFALIALYHFTVAGTVALELQYGVVYARLMVAGIYTALALASFTFLWAMGRKATTARASGEPSPRAMSIAMLVEAALLGFEVSRKGKKAS